MQTPEEYKRKAREYRAKRRPHLAKLNADWIRANRDKYNASKAKYRIKLKREVMALYCDPVACVCCGFTRLDGLVLDHVNNDGAEHRRSAGIASRGNPFGGRIYEYIRKNGKLPGLQVLCANCNMIKQLEHNRENSIKDMALLYEVNAYANQAPE